MMKTRMIMISGLFVMLFTGCQQEQIVELNQALDVAITFEASENVSGVPEYLNLSLKNESPDALMLPNGLIVLEFTSYSGSIQRFVSLTEDLVDADPAWHQLKQYALQPGEKLNLRVELAEILLGSTGRESMGLPPDSYTLNAFLTPEKDMESIAPAPKVRSNYIELEVRYSQDDLSLNEM